MIAPAPTALLERVIFGIDPGLLHTGWGLVRIASDGALGYLDCGVISTFPRESVANRLAQIHRELTDRLKEAQKRHTALEVAIEETFVNINAKSSLVLGMARGVALLAVAQAELVPVSYANNTIKSAVTGNGQAPKEQVGEMVRLLLPELAARTATPRTVRTGADKKVSQLPAPRHRLRHDTLDALAVAICHAHTQTTDTHATDISATEAQAAPAPASAKRAVGK